MRPFQTPLISLFFFISCSLNIYANPLDAWLELESSSLAPHKKIAISNSRLKKNKLMNDKEGELYAYIQLAVSSQSLENYQQSKQYLILAEQLNKLVNSDVARVKISNTQARAFSTAGEMKHAVEIMTSSLALATTIDDVLLQGDTLMQYAYIMHLDLQYKAAIESLYKAQLIFEKLEDNNRVMAVQSYLAMIYADLKNYPKAIEYYEHAVVFAKELQDDFNLSIFCYNLGTAYSSLKDWQKSSFYFSQARELSRLLDDSVGIALATAQLGAIMVKNHQYQDALPLLLEANNMLQDDGTVLMRTRLKLDIALSYAKQQKIALTKIFLQEADTLSKGEKINRYPYKLMGDIYRELGNYKRAANIYAEHIERINTDFKTKRESSLQRLEVAYDVQFEKSRNEILRKENLLKEAKLIQHNQYRLILVLILALVLLMLAGTFRQIKIQRNHKQKFKELAFKDELTKVANRRGILAFAKSSYQKIKIDDKQLIIAIIDLDHFKKVNDTYGHDVGDQVLKYFAMISSKSLRSYERIGRFGGEEWLVVLPNAKPAELDNKFKQLLKAYQESRPTTLPKDLMLSFSMGAVIVEADDNRSIQDLLKQADGALYKAKEGGRGRYEVVN